MSRSNLFEDEVQQNPAKAVHLILRERGYVWVRGGSVTSWAKVSALVSFLDSTGSGALLSVLRNCSIFWHRSLIFGGAPLNLFVFLL